ncbi:MAG: YkgJ family cysteine cluster protein [Planctomycetota bacterium]|nr:YkgJ family cysteine cluster protein [Planctomycetota bacterium]
MAGRTDLVGYEEQAQAAPPEQRPCLTLEGLAISLPLPRISGAVHLSGLVAPARVICDALGQALSQWSARHDRPIPCRKGCSACCRYLVPLSVPEALALPGELSAREGPRPARSRGRLLAAATTLLRAGPPPESGRLDPTQATQALADWYASAGVTCPFLSKHRCGIYAARPLACREHFSASSRACASPRAGGEASLNWGISVSAALADLAAELEGRPAEAVMLPLALPWWQENRRRNETLYSGDQAVARLGQLLESQARRAAEFAENAENWDKYHWTDRSRIPGLRS